jgi:hypothetical protein
MVMKQFEKISSTMVLMRMELLEVGSETVGGVSAA